jgi:HPt (histidine-containing phosphotransfer) domain-containing protein
MSTVLEPLQVVASSDSRFSGCVVVADAGRGAAPCLDGARRPAPLDYGQLVRRCMGKVELVERLLASFEERVPKELSQIHDALAMADVPRLSRLAHQFKGTTANISAPEMQAIAACMDKAAREGRTSDVGAHLTDVEQAWRRFQDFRAQQTRKALR